jgi:hypothetical protein
MPDPVRSAHARVAALKRHQASPVAVAVAERDLRAELAAVYLRDLNGAEPALTLEQRRHLVGLLLPGRPA